MYNHHRSELIYTNEQTQDVQITKQRLKTLPQVTRVNPKQQLIGLRCKGTEFVYVVWGVTSLGGVSST